MPQLEVTGSYVGVEALKRASNLHDTSIDALILEHVNAASRDIERLTFRRFFPLIATAKYRWPPFHVAASWEVWLDDDLLSVTLVQAAASGQNASPVTITHFFLEPQYLGPPYSRIEVDLSSADVFQSGVTPQQSIAITGLWGYTNITIRAGTLAVAITDPAATSLTCSDASKIDQGDVLLIDSEAIYVDNPRTQVDTTATLTGAIDSSTATQTVVVNNATLVNVGESILIDAESMLVTAITGNSLLVRRAWDGTSTATHSSGAHVYAPRGLTLQRGVNGTTAATHLVSAPISKYQAPLNIRRAVRADAIGSLQQDLASWGRTVGSGEMATEFQGAHLETLIASIIDEFGRGPKVAAV